MNPQESLTRKATSCSPPLRLAMIGTGSILRHHLPAFQSRSDAIHLSAICDINPEATSAVAAQLPYPVPIYSDYRAILKTGNTDALLIALPHHLHYPIAAEAVAAGIPVSLKNR